MSFNTSVILTFMIMIGVVAAVTIGPFAIIILVSLISAKSQKKKNYEAELALQRKKEQPIVLQDANAIKVRYRMNLMDTFIRKTFRQVKTWKSLGDERAFHPMFFDNNWKGHHNVEIQMLDGTKITQMIMIDPKTDTLSLPPVKDKPKETPEQKQSVPIEKQTDAQQQPSITIQELKGMTLDEIQKLISDNQ